MTGHMIENLKNFDRMEMQKIANFSFFMKKQLFRLFVISLVIFNLQEHTIHQNKAKDISFRPNFITFMATINI